MMMHTLRLKSILPRTAVLVAVAATVLVVGGCSNGGTGSAGQLPGSTKSMDPKMSMGSSAAAGAVLNLTATEYSFAPSAPKASAGKTTIRLTDNGAEGHDFTIDALHLHITTTPGKTADAIVILRPGTYTFYCSIPGHLQSGMTGKLTVS
jgi:uncharacterized cupredoxin-like copper-binding protein